MIYYVLKCEKGMYYVGKTDRELITRFKEHSFDSTCSFTSKYKPISILYSEQVDNDNTDENKTKNMFYEDNLVKKYMLEYGINNVRGGSYSTLNLSNTKIKFLKKELFSSINGCFKCGRTSHFCNKCYAKTDIFGESLITLPPLYPKTINKRVRSTSECSEYGGSDSSSSDEDDMEMIAHSVAKTIKSVYNYFTKK
jgi:predicted GIY-YIG superfamily endonuclease